AQSLLGGMQRLRQHGGAPCGGLGSDALRKLRVDALGDGDFLVVGRDDLNRAVLLLATQEQSLRRGDVEISHSASSGAGVGCGANQANDAELLPSAAAEQANVVPHEDVASLSEILL